MKKENKHIFKYDLLRLVFMMMTLGVHVVAYSINIDRFNEWYYYRMMLDGFFIICNPLFFMLSGRLNLDKEFSKKEDYIKFYLKRFLSLIVPFFIISLMLQLLLYGNFNDFISRFISNGIEPNGTFWFVYALVAIVVLSPFYSKMLKGMNKEEKKIFLYICIILNAIISTLNILNIKTAINFGGVGILNWHLYYFAGYLIEDVFDNKRTRTIIYILGILAFLYVNGINLFVKYIYAFKEPGLFLTLQAFAIYLALLNSDEIKNQKVRKVISFISKYAYVFYLLHMFVVENISKHINFGNSLIYTIWLYCLCFGVTLLCSVIVQELIIAPIQKQLKKILKL